MFRKMWEPLLLFPLASGIGFSKFISTGNEADLRLEDYLEYLAQDQDTKIITAYIEGLRAAKTIAGISISLLLQFSKTTS